MRNQAFAFIKPHAMKSQAVATYISDVFQDEAVEIALVRSISGREIADQGLIDRQFGLAAQAALTLSGAKLTLSAEGREIFLCAFDESWDAAVAAGKVLNSTQACEQLDGMEPNDLGTAWAEHGAVEVAPDIFVSWFKEYGFYVVNGFYPAIRAGYVAEGVAIQAMLLDFEMDWWTFRERVVGSENPAAALEDSIRSYLYERAGVLEMVIDPVDNILHVSASPFEALCEKMIWLAPDQWANDPLLVQLAARLGKTPDVVAAWVLAKRSDSALRAQMVDLDTATAADWLYEKALAKNVGI